MSDRCCPNCDCHWCGWTPDEKYPWWSWENANPDVVARRTDGVVMEQCKDSWRVGDPAGEFGTVVWEIDFIEHHEALAAYDESYPREVSDE